MPKNVLITPASGLVQFYDDTNNVDATIQLDNANVLNITGNVAIGDLAANVYIGDGVNTVDVIFEQNGAIRALAGKTLTLGQSTSNISFAANITSGANITGNVVGGNLRTTGLVSATGNVTGGNIISQGTLTTVGKPTFGAITLPNTDGSTGQTLTTYGNGVVYWSTSGGSVSGTFNVFTRAGSIAISVISGFFDVTLRSGSVLKIPVS